MKRIPFLLAMLAICHFAHAATYYVSLSGDDANSGTSPSSPWQTTVKVDSTVFAPGDVILFEGGSTFQGTLYFDAADQGTPANPITISSYGTGTATISSGIEVGIYVYNAAGYKITNIKFLGSGLSSSDASGVLFYMDSATTKNRLKYIFIDNVEVSGYRDDGIGIGSHNGPNGFDDVTITNCSIHDIGEVGIGSFALSRLGHTNFYIGNNEVFNISGTRDTSRHTGDGILFGGVDGAIIENCHVYNNGWLNKCVNAGPIGIWAFQSNNVVIRKNESHHNRTGTTKDGGGFDLDYGATNCVIEYNYSHDNEGGGLLLCQRFAIYQMSNNIVRYNTSENDGLKNGYGAIHLYSDGKAGGINNCQVYNNKIISPFSKAIQFSGVGIYNTVFKNNTFIPTSTTKFTISSTATNLNVSFQRNDYGDPALFKVIIDGKTYKSLKAWRDKTLQENQIIREVWRNVPGSSVKAIPVKQIPSLITYMDNYETEQNYADNYGERISGYITAPQTGSYTFWVASDDDCKVLLSTNADPANKVKLVNFVGQTAYRNFTQSKTQKSKLIPLVAGNKYYIEILHKDSIGADHMSLRWKLPDGTIETPIPGTDYSSAKTLIASNASSSEPEMEQPKTLTLTAFPNPFGNASRVLYSSKIEQKVTLLMYDMQGKLIRQLFTGTVQKNATNQLDIDAFNLPGGMYMIKFAGNKESLSYKLIHQK